MINAIRTIVIDQQPIFRVGLANVLGQESDFDIVGAGATKAEALRLVDTVDPDLMLIDTDVGGCGITTAIEAKRIARRPLRVMFLTCSESRETVVAALRAGASAYMLKSIRPEILLQTLRMVENGETYVMPALASRLLIGADAMRQLDDPTSALTIREREILKEVSSGQTNKEIARRLNLSEKTIKHHVGRVLQKLSVRNRTEAVIVSRRIADARPSAPAHGPTPKLVALPDEKQEPLETL